MNDGADLSLSVVVVSHNYGGYLDEALTSVIRQGRPPDEIVLIDDASSDNTPAVAERWAKNVPSLSSMRNESRLGPARTFNRGFASSSGKLLVKLDGDDRFADGYLSALESALVTRDADIAYSGLRLFGAESREIPVKAFDRRELHRENFINGSAMMRRSVWERTGGFRDELDGLGLEDWELFVHAISLGMHATPVEDCWLEYRRHAHGSRNSISRLDALRAHWFVRCAHRDEVGIKDVGAWMARSVRRNLTGASMRHA